MEHSIDVEWVNPPLRKVRQIVIIPFEFSDEHDGLALGSSQVYYIRMTPVRLTPSDTGIEFLMLCDSAQTTQEGKLYVLGGGWTQVLRLLPPVGVPMVPPPNQFAIAASFLFDWNDANRPIGIRVTVEHQEERPPLFEARAQITAGRPPQSTPGDPLRALIALPILMNFPESGSYCVRAQMEGAEDAVVRFRVNDSIMPVTPVG